MDFIFLCILALAGLCGGLYIMRSAITKDKNKRIELPEQNIHGFFVISPAKKGQEWVVFLIGLSWTLFWGAALLILVTT